MRLNLQQQNLLVAFIDGLPFTLVNQSNQRADGIEGQLLSTLAEYFNFSTTFVDCMGDFGDLKSDGNWTGLIGKIFNKEADLGFGGIAISYEELRDVQFFHYHFIDQFGFVTKNITNPIDPGILLKPYDRSVWIYLLFSLFIVYLLSQLQSHFLSLKLSSSSIFWLKICALFHQSYIGWSKLSLTYKICFTIWMFAMMVLSNLYGGNLCSILATPSPHPFETIEKLAQACRSGFIIPLGLNTPFYDNLIISEYLQIVSSKEEAIQMILQSKSLEFHGSQQQYAFIYSRERLRLARSFYGHNLLYVPPRTKSTFFSMIMAMPVRTDFPYRKPFDRIISQIFDCGLIEQWENLEIFMTRTQHNGNHNYNYNDIMENTDEIVNRLTLFQFKSLFILYLICLLLATFLFIIEIWIHSQWFIINIINQTFNKRHTLVSN
ncbi:elongation factor 1-gamma isoform X3 [Dermatophagoides farinae]|uniref:elongation factor 1-gamma isoform X3 n=1 Tax=Dermatophagoides farinae TaxID=6954 RepID=UPI003F631707